MDLAAVYYTQKGSTNNILAYNIDKIVYIIEVERHDVVCTVHKQVTSHWDPTDAAI